MRKVRPPFHIMAVIAYCLMALVFLLASCGKESQKQAPEKSPGESPIKVILAENPVPLSSVTIVAKAKGFFKNQGLDVVVKKLTSGKLALDAVLGGGADFATVAETPLMYAGFVKLPAVVLATFTYSDNDCKVAARRDLGIEKPIDLKGRKVATFVGTSAEFFMNAFLNGHSLSASDVQVVTLQPSDMPTALERGDIAAFFIWEPHIYNARRIGGDKVIVFTGQEFYTETFNLAATRKYVTNNPEVPKKMLSALLEAEYFIRDHPDEAITIVSEVTGMDRTVLKDIWQDFTFQVVLDPFLLKYLKLQAQWAIKSEIVKDTTVPDYRPMIFEQPLKDIKPEAVRILIEE